MPRAWRLAVVVAVLLASAGLAAGLMSGHLAGGDLRHGRPAVDPAAATPAVLQVTPAPYLLPVAIWGATARADGSQVLLAGGARSASTGARRSGTGTTRSAILLDPVTGATRPAAISAQIRTARPGQALVDGPGGAYVVGAAAGDPPSADVRAYGSARVAARLPVPVSGPAAVVLGGQLWVFGGRSAGGVTTAIQRVDLTTGTARVAGRLPWPVQGAAALVVGGRILVAGGLTAAPGGGAVTSGMVLTVDPATGTAVRAGMLPVPVAYPAAAVVGGTGYLLGGLHGRRAVPAVTTFRLVPPSRAVPPPDAVLAGPDPPAAGPASGVLRQAPWLGPPLSAAHLAPGSDPSVLPGDVLIADHLNNRLLIVDPQGRIRWEFPRPGDLRPGQSFLVPDDAFFSPDGRSIIVTQEDDQVISVIDIATSTIVYRYGAPGTPGAGPNRVDNPDDAMLAPGGGIIAADIKNCRILQVMPPAHRPLRVVGQSSYGCVHDPPRTFGSPNGAFPLTDGQYLVTEINGDWTDKMSVTGHVAWSVHPPGVLYPSDTNEVYPGRYLTADYSSPGQLVEFNGAGRLLWRFGGLNQPSLALPLPNGDILANDDFNHRVIVIDPVTGRIVWQYGHTGKAGSAPGYLNDPDGVDLAPPDSMLITHAGVMGRP
jgi:hypothetical protein